jgi:2-deoxy-D-gluconate 3-dehydrogenase
VPAGAVTRRAILFLQGGLVMAAARMFAKMFDLSGKVSVVTGGNGGIGRGIALGLAEAGAAVAILARNEEKNRTVLGELRELNVASIALRLDVTDRGALAPAMAEVERQLGPVDILVNNAGIAIPGGVLKLEAADWDRVIETNLNSGFLLSQIAARSMAARKRGKIINIASEYSLFGNPILPSYAASKGAVVQLTKSMAVELAAHNIQVNAILPGWIESDLTAPIKEHSFFNEVIKRTPAGRLGTPQECAAAAVFLASHASDFVTGATIVVDGGYAIR